MHTKANNSDWIRNHFPVIMETNMSNYFNEVMYADMGVEDFTFPTLEFRGFRSGQL